MLHRPGSSMWLGRRTLTDGGYINDTGEACGSIPSLIGGSFLHSLLFLHDLIEQERRTARRDEWENGFPVGSRPTSPK